MSSLQSSTDKFDLSLTPWTEDFSKIKKPPHGVRFSVTNLPENFTIDNPQYKLAEDIAQKITVHAAELDDGFSS